MADISKINPNGDIYNIKDTTAREGLNSKADKVSNATANNFATLDGNGNLTDSGISKNIVPIDVDPTNNKLVTRNDIPTELNDLSGDVSITSPINAQILKYNSTSGKWENQTEQPPVGGATFKGSILFVNIPTTGMINGDWYDIKDAFTTDNRFEEGSGIACAAGTDIIWVTEDNKWNILTPSGVYSFNGRLGAVVPASGDYDANDIDYDNTTSGLTATNVQDAIDELESNKADSNNIPTAYTNNPEMDGTASAGTSSSWAKGNHVHPTDTSRASASDLTNHINNKSNPHSVTASQVGLGSVVNTGDSATPVSGGTTKFTTGGAYTELNKKANKISSPTNGNFVGMDSDGNLTNSGSKASDFSTVKTRQTPTSGGTTLSLVNTGDMYTWNNKASTNTATTSANGLMSSTDKTKLNGIASGAEVNVQADWNVTDDSSDAFIKNKPTIPAAQVNSDWNATSGVAQILNKPTIPSITNCYQTGDTAETALADGDYFPFYDTSATAKRKTLWSNIKSVLKTYFDTLYSTVKSRGTPTSGGTTLSLVNTGDMYTWNNKTNTSVKGNAESSYRTGQVNITPANIGLGNVGNFKAVSTVASQELTDTEKANARDNIGAGTSSVVANPTGTSTRILTSLGINGTKYTIQGGVGDVSINTTGTASDTSTCQQQLTVDGVSTDISGSKYMETSTYTTPSTGIRRFTFTGDTIQSTSVFDFYCDVFNVAPIATMLDTTSATHSLAVDFNASDNVTTCRIYIRG